MKLPRLFGWLIATSVLLALTLAFQPQQLAVTAYKVCLVTLAGVLGYWLDRSLFPYARPDMFLALEQVAPASVGASVDAQLCDGKVTYKPAACDPDLQDCAIEVPVSADAVLSGIFAASMVRRAVIVGCAMLAVGLGA